MNVSEWIKRVKYFSENLRIISGDVELTVEIGSVIDHKTINSYESYWPSGIPACLRQLWNEGCSQINCRYIWTPQKSQIHLLQEIFEGNLDLYGGVCFEPADQIFPGNSGITSDDVDMQNSVGKNGLELWCRCAVFMRVGNGDCLGLDITSNYDNPAVVYLSYTDNNSKVISITFTEFLLAWEELCYVGPEIWMLEYWLDKKNHRLDPTIYKTDMLRKLLTINVDLGQSFGSFPAN